MNFINIAGHLGADPETRFTSSGKKVTTLRVACRSRKGQNDATIWYRVTIWGDQYDKLISYLKKGSSVVVCGELQPPEIFNDREGKPQISMDITASYIQFSPFGKSGSGGSQTQSTQGMAAASDSFSAAAQSAPSSFNSPFAESVSNHSYPGSFKGEIHDDEVPF